MLERIAGPLAGLSNGTASVLNRLFGALGRPGHLLQSFLNGTWLGHPLHAVIVDVVVGAATAAVLLDVLRLYFGVSGTETATSWVLGLALLAAIGALVTGLTDFKDTGPGATRNVVGLHGLINLVGTGGFALSTLQRIGGDHDAAFLPLLVGYLVISVGAYIGGHVVFKYGYTVNVNAFARGRRAKEFTAVLPAADLPDATPTRASLGGTALVLVRRGDVVHALKDTCSHAGGPLSGGALDGDSIVCPWHRSAYRLRDGAVRRGPATNRQPSYRARIHEGQVEVLGPE